VVSELRIVRAVHGAARVEVENYIARLCSVHRLQNHPGLPDPVSVPPRMRLCKLPEILIEATNSTIDTGLVK